jgi:large subunit ribosomal protein L6
MSRIGKLPITVPNGVTVTQNGNTMTVKGPRGELTRSLPQAITVTLENGTLTVTRPSEDPQHRALHGLTRTLVSNMVEGVTKGFQKTLEIVGVGYKAENRPFGLQMSLGSRTRSRSAPAAA